MNLVTDLSQIERCMAWIVSEVMRALTEPATKERDERLAELRLREKQVARDWKRINEYYDL